jgi:UDP-2,3-diacylglucosamine hydrolase
MMQLQAPASWRTVDLISDLHLQASEPATFAAWQHYMANTSADAVLILGDLFEVWVGDDAVAESSFLQACADVLQTAGNRLYLGLMHGNRDFLLGESFVRQCHGHLLDDPTVLTWGKASWLLSHGDALCTDDVEYQAFRNQVRTPQWARIFLDKPLAERQEMARHIRSQSELRKQASPVPTHYADADPALCQQWLAQAQASTLIHGHTHQAADHLLPGQLPQNAGSKVLKRLVLSDWDLSAEPARAQVLRLSANGEFRRINHA